MLDRTLLEELKRELREEIKQELREELKEELRQELKEELKKELLSQDIKQDTEKEKKRNIKVLGREELQKIFGCGKTKMNEIMHSVDAPPVVYIGRNYYTTEKQLNEYFEDRRNVKKGRKRKTEHTIDENDNNDSSTVLYKKDLMELFKMGRTTFKKFIDTHTLPIKKQGAEYYITENTLQKWFYEFEGKKENGIIFG